ncbi:MAG: hypothetical protein ABWK00_01975 [Desulfurococcaceae archaeon]
MKELVEYVLAALVIISAIPIYNAIVSSLAGPPQGAGGVDPNVLASVQEAVGRALAAAYVAGNLSPLLPWGIDYLRNLTYSLAGSSLPPGYGLYVSVYTPIVGATLNGSALTALAAENGTMRALLVYSDGSSSASSATGSPAPSGYYAFKFDVANASGLAAAVLVLESGAARYLYYYLPEGTGLCAPLSINGTMGLLCGSSAPAMNATLFYYSGGAPGYGNYSSLSYVALVNATLGGPTFVQSIYYNVSDVRYSAVGTGRPYNSTHSYYLVRMNRLDTMYANSSCTWSNALNDYICSKRSRVGSYAYSFEIGYPVANLVLLYVNATGYRAVAPTYFAGLSYGDRAPPGAAAASSTFYVRLGSFDYLVRVTVWRR